MPAISHGSPTFRPCDLRPPSPPCTSLTAFPHTAFLVPEATSSPRIYKERTRPHLLPEESPGFRHASSHYFSFLTHSAGLGASG